MKECDLLDCGSLLPLWCGQPAAKQRAGQVLEIRESAPQQAVERKAAAGCSSPKCGNDRRDMALENLAAFVEFCYALGARVVTLVNNRTNNFWPKNEECILWHNRHEHGYYEPQPPATG